MNARTPAEFAYAETNAKHRAAHEEWRCAAKAGDDAATASLQATLAELDSQLDSLEAIIAVDALSARFSADSDTAVSDLRCLLLEAFAAGKRASRTPDVLERLSERDEAELTCR